MRGLLPNIAFSLEKMAGPHLLDNLALPIFDVLRRFDGATTVVVRDHLKQWAATKERHERGPRQRFRGLGSQ
jgi:hypothetical protein